MQEEKGGVENQEAAEKESAAVNQEAAETVASENDASILKEAVLATGKDEAFSDDEEEVSEEEQGPKLEDLDENGKTALVETVLFLESDSRNEEALSQITGLSVEDVKKALVNLTEKYSSEDSGIELVMKLGGWLLSPKRSSFDFVKERYGKKNEGRLSRAAIETLSIIAYSQPITRPENESIRHVSADTMIRLLLDRKLIKKVGEKDVPGRPTMYGTTPEFLEFFHLQSIAELPQLEEEEQKRFELAR